MEPSAAAERLALSYGFELKTATRMKFSVPLHKEWADPFFLDWAGPMQARRRHVATALEAIERSARSAEQLHNRHVLVDCLYRLQSFLVSGKETSCPVDELSAIDAMVVQLVDTLSHWAQQGDMRRVLRFSAHRVAMRQWLDTFHAATHHLHLPAPFGDLNVGSRGPISEKSARVFFSSQFGDDVV